MKKHSMEVLFNSQEIMARVCEMGQVISRDFAGEDLLVVGILKGSFIFMADLVRYISIPVEVDFMAMSSYGSSTQSSGQVQIAKDLDTPITGKNVLVVEDIVDTGLTLKCILAMLWKRNPKSIRVCTLLDKPSRRKTDISPDYCGFTVPDDFVVGYGLDYAGKHRNYRAIYILNPEYDNQG